MGKGSGKFQKPYEVFKALNKCKTTTLLEDNIGKYLRDLELRGYFLDTTSKAQSMKKRTVLS